MATRRGAGAALIFALLIVGLAPVRATAPASPAPGSLDLSYGSCGVATLVPDDPESPQDEVFGVGGRAIAVQPDGKTLLAGDWYVARFRTDGSADYGFGRNGWGAAFPPRVENRYPKAVAVAVRPDGRILVGAVGETLSTPLRWPVFAQLLPNGAVDTSFGDNGVKVLDVNTSITSMALQADGTVVAAGDHTVLRILPDGLLDPNFGDGGVVAFDGFDMATAATQADGKVIVGMRSGANNGEIVLTRLNADGTLDATYGSGGHAVSSLGPAWVSSLVVDAAGRTVAAINVGNVSHTELVRRLPNGDLDPAFGDGGTVNTQSLPGYPAGTPEGLVVGPDGRMVIASMGYGYELTLSRFTAAGALDPSFGNVGSTVYRAYDGLDSSAHLAQLPDGGYVVGSRNFRASVVRFNGGSEPTPATPVTADTCRKSLTLAPQATSATPPGGLGSTPRAYTLTSTGTAPVRVDGAAFIDYLIANSGPFYPEMLSDGCTGKSLAPGASCQLLVRGVPVFVLVSSNAERGQTVFGAGGASAYMMPAEAWGWNANGQVGAGPADASNSPTPVGIDDAYAVAAGYLHTLAVRSDGSVWAWGWNGVGQLGDGTTTDRRTPVKVPGLNHIVTVAAGAHSSFAIDWNGAVYAWGWNASGQLGDGTLVDRHSPVRIGGLPPMAMVSGGPFHTLAIAADQTVWSWGWNGLGQLGDGTVVDHYSPKRVPGLLGGQVAAGAFHSLAVNLNGDALGWGWNGVGQLGDGTTTDRWAPTPVQGLTGGVNWIAAGAFHSLAINRGAPVAWGWNAVGQLGDGTYIDRHSPVAVPLPIVGLFYRAASTVVAGAYHSFATTEHGVVWAWGWNGAGQLGDGARNNAPAPTRVPLTAPVMLGGGLAHSVAG